MADTDEVPARSILLDRLRADVIGPKGGAEETIDERPSARYLTAILYPQQSEFSEEEDETVSEENGGGGGTGEDDEQQQVVSLFRSFKPATCGFSFSVSTSDGIAALLLTVSFARYEPLAPVSEGETGEKWAPNLWRRVPTSLPYRVGLDEGVDEVDLVEGLGLYRKVRTEGGLRTVTIQFVNRFRELPRETGTEPKKKRDVTPPADPLVVYDQVSRERGSFFQFEAVVTCEPGCEFVPRPRALRGNDDDEKIAELIYRDFAEYAVGHTASAQWDPPTRPERVSLTWLPTSLVKRMDAAGDPIIADTLAAAGIGNLHGLALAFANDRDLVATLTAIPDAYAAWILARREEIYGIGDARLRVRATLNMDQCERAMWRIREGIDLIRRDPIVARAFRIANRAMYVQAAWANGRATAHRDVDPSNGFAFAWRPFQIAFALMCLPSTTSRDHEDRDVFDLIWFPTGGGKTEAYLLLAAFVLTHRRLAHGAAGVGVGVLMRYTLRTLTVQQFQRATALVTACEQLRQTGGSDMVGLGDAPFTIGLWVGRDTTPNQYEVAVQALRDLDPKSTPKQLTQCPVCAGELIWEADDDTRSITCRCPAQACVADRAGGRVPVLTVDEDLYAAPPSLLIGTVDKFAQIPRKAATGAFFATDGLRVPPDLIIQDELHLIGGPLGSLTGLYEVAIDCLCSTPRGPAKIIGSTATIRRADEQIRQVFDRRSFQFPPPALDAANSCFAKRDEEDEGRLYVGLTTAGRSEKFALQAVSASLLQGTYAPILAGRADVDGYRTLVAYFNSLKVLGGALVLMEDDVRITIDALHQQWNEPMRTLGTPHELTSRKASSEIPLILAQLAKPTSDPECVDVLLASNMLSVGVDIPRLGLMLVNGQPKFMAEYIQATSRVGRRDPGLIVTVYNNNKIRDRAHYEAFSSWHGALYRSVEPSSTTPFAPRARDKAIHAPLAALIRHGLSPTSPRLGRKQEAAMMAYVDLIVRRIANVDPTEAVPARRELTRFVTDWLDASEAGTLKFYWNDRYFNSSLMMSAEVAAARRATGKQGGSAAPTPNSVRNVEPSVDFILRERA